MNKTFLFDAIRETVLEIETEINEINGKGVFFAPELHIAFCIGKAIMKNKINIFGTNNVEWKREVKLNEYGLYDIVFEVLGKQIAIEIKLKETDTKYKADIEKLRKLPENVDKFFCVLINRFSNENKDPRFLSIQNEYKNNLNPIDCHSFPTWDTFERKVHCDLHLFSVINNPLELTQ